MTFEFMSASLTTPGTTFKYMSMSRGTLVAELETEPKVLEARRPDIASTRTFAETFSLGGDGGGGGTSTLMSSKSEQSYS